MTADARPRAVLVFPGRGAYGPTSLGSLSTDHPLVAVADHIRAELGLDSLASLDAAETFDPAVHLRPSNNGPLTWLASMLDAERALADHRVVAVIGNSPGWFAALAVANALDPADAFRIVQGLAFLQEEGADTGAGGGQLIYPRLDIDWQPMPEWDAALNAMSEDGGEVFPSVDLGGFVILAGTDEGIDRVAGRLPAVELGERQYPLRLGFHVPYHTPLQDAVAAAAVTRFADLPWEVPQLTLIDGRGERFTPWTTDPAELAAYTLGEQLVSPYRFALGARVALREYAPDVLVLPGPGNTMGGVMGQVVVTEGYRGLRTRADFEAAQAGPAPLVLSMR
jgi:[acyl-carrier-protein] S-malonyltransferase